MKDYLPKSRKVVAVHLLNNYSGSPRVFAQAINGLLAKGFSVDLFVGNKDQEGFLSDMNTNTTSFGYKFYNNKLLRLYTLIKSQIVLFFKLMKYRNEEVAIYVNTYFPFGAALAGWLMRKDVVFHMHETRIEPKVLKLFLRQVAQRTAHSAIYVSHYLKQAEKLPKTNCQVVHNALSESFWSKAALSVEKEAQTPMGFTVSMISSLKTYKGVHHFVELARSLPECRFDLVADASAEELDTFFEGRYLPKNLFVYSRQEDIHPIYRQSDVVVNLSDPEWVVESFGMTLLEAMAYGKPVIGPPVGGPSEIIEDGQNGYLIHPRDRGKMVEVISTLAKNPKYYKSLSENARERARSFKINEMQQAVWQVLAS